MQSENYEYECDLNLIIGEMIMKVYVSKDKTILIIITQGQDRSTFTYEYRAGADCCAETYIESIESIEPGSIVKDIESLGYESLTSEDVYPDKIDLWGYRIVTDKGTSVISMRTESNGYYSGSLEFIGKYRHGFHDYVEKVVRDPIRNQRMDLTKFFDEIK